LSLEGARNGVFQGFIDILTDLAIAILQSLCDAINRLCVDFSQSKSSFSANLHLFVIQGF
jgi:hypothetical protein